MMDDEDANQSQQQCPQCGGIHSTLGLVERLRERRDWCIKEAEKMTRILDHFDSHEDVRAFVKLFDQLRQEEMTEDASRD